MRVEQVDIMERNELLQAISAAVAPGVRCYWRRTFVRWWESYGSLEIAFSLWRGQAPVIDSSWADKAANIVRGIYD